MITKLRIRAYNSQVPLVLVNYLLQDDLYEKHGNMTKNTQSRKVHFHPTHSKREERPTTNRIRARRNGEQGQIPTKPSHLCRTPTQAHSRRSKKTPDKVGLKVAQQGCGRTHGRFILPLQRWLIRCRADSTYLQGGLVLSMWG